MIVLPNCKRESFRRRGGSPGAGRALALALGAAGARGMFDLHAAAVPHRRRADRIDQAGGPAAVERLSIRATGGSPNRFSRRACARRRPAEPGRWSNAETGDRGEFLPVAGTFAREGQSCRAFVARLVDGKDAKTLQAVGCPSESGEVAIYDVSPWTGL